ncbi:MAG: class II fructose-bisphosphate aldolase [Planctomycetota bacterium]
MQPYTSLSDLAADLRKVAQVAKDGKLTVIDPKTLRETTIDRLIQTAVFGASADLKDAARWAIRTCANATGAISSSIQGLYDAVGKGRCGGFTTPAINIRGLTYDISRALFRTAKATNAGAFVFEIARSEMGYTEQRPAEYSAAVLAAAIKEGHTGPVFIQGDHFQVNAKKYAAEPDKELGAIRDLCKEALAAGFYNIDIDTSTLVDLSRQTIKEQQRLNFDLCADYTLFIRDLEPKGVTTSVGGEIGEVGKKNSTVEELENYLDGYAESLQGRRPGSKGISKISVQTGTSHGGVPLPDGTVAEVKLDFGTLIELGKVAREKYGLSGAVQHGASTLPAELFNRFPKSNTSEIHLATEFQNMIYESEAFPKELKDTMYAWLRANCKDEAKAGETDEQFIYKTRKKGFGTFKKELWGLPAATKETILNGLQVKFRFLFEQLNVPNTASLVRDHIMPTPVPVPVPSALSSAL